MNQVKLFHLNAACTVLTFYFIAYTFILSNSVMGYVQNKAMVDSHHVIFDNLGKMSTGITYINVAIPLNISIFATQIGLFDSFLTNLITAYTNTTNNSSSKLDIINAQNMVTLTKAITHYARQRLYTLQHQLPSIDNQRYPARNRSQVITSSHRMNHSKNLMLDTKDFSKYFSQF